MINPSPADADKLRRYRYLALATSIMIFLLIVIGGILRVSGSDNACPDWPTCFGQWTSLIKQSATLDYLHRAFTLLSAPLILASAVAAWRQFRNERWISVPMTIALFLFVVQVILGGYVALNGKGTVGPWLAIFHLGLSLLVQACVLISTVVVFYLLKNPELTSQKQPISTRSAFGSPFARLSLVTIGILFSVLVSGAIVSATGSTLACDTWPLCGNLFMIGGIGEWISIVHRLTVIFAGTLMGVMLVKAWQTQRTNVPVLVAVTAAGVLFFAQALLGAQMVDGFPDYHLGLHMATSAAVWGIMIILVAAIGLTAPSAAEERSAVGEAGGRTGIMKDLLMLTKPIVVILLLVTTFAGMVIGGRAWPPVAITFWTLLGGFMAAGGSGAINQYIDRIDDGKMQRTKKRPIPSGRLTPGEGLAFGVGMTIAAFFIMVAFVNLLAALLTLAGIIYYVLIYSIYLKKSTVLNIVIGGGAGAIPPLVGWAAVTGSLNIPALFLFAIVFMWTPPHFWALALVRRKDYARAGVPMMPVIRGERETRWQIFLYTVELVVLTLVLPLFGLGGGIYLVGAVILGGWLLLAAWKVWKRGGNMVAWKMYRYSSMYLAFLFLVLMIDRLM